MRHGKFFNLDLDNSSTEHGITLFDYTGLTSYDDIGQHTKMLPKYPVRLSITPTSVKFILHYSTYRKSNNDGTIHTIEPFGEEMDDASTSITHIEDTIIDLPFAGMGSENLTSIIGKLYSSEFPISSRSSEGVSYGNQFLYDRITALYGPSGSKIMPESSQEIMPKGSPEHYHIHAYSSLNCETLDGKWKTLDIFDENGHCNGFLRKLMLDFMFDMVHSDVFQNSAGFNAMYTGLMSNFYFASLLHKYEYHFYHQLMWDELYNTPKPSYTDDKLYHDHKSHAEKLWLQDIISPDAEQLFRISSYNKDPEWFRDPESEMRFVCFPSLPKDCPKRKRSRIIYDKIGPEQENRKDISQWFMSRYDFMDVFRFHKPRFFPKPAGQILVSFAMLLTLISIIPWPWAKLPVVAFIFTLVLVFAVAIHKLCKRTLDKNLHIFFPRLAAGIATGWITIAVGFDLFSAFFDMNATGRWQNILYVIAIVFVLSLLLVYKINQATPRLESSKKLKRAGVLLLFGYCISMVIGITLVDLLGERYLARGGDVEKFYKEFDNTRYAYEGKSDILKLGEGEVSREELVNALTRTYHINYGEVWYSHPIATKVHILSNKVEWLDWFTFFYLRDFTVIFSFIALFIGIFIQLIIFGADKKITEV